MHVIEVLSSCKTLISLHPFLQAFDIQEKRENRDKIFLPALEKRNHPHIPGRGALQKKIRAIFDVLNVHLKNHYLHLLATVVTAKTNWLRLSKVDPRTILSAAPGVDVSALGQDYHMVVSTRDLADQPLLKELQKHRLQNLLAELPLHSDAAVIVGPKHVHLVLICESGSNRTFTKSVCEKMFLLQIPGCSHQLHRP